MKIIRHNQVHKIDNSPTTHVEEYLHNNKDINIAVITLSSRYPDIGYVVNKKCKELVYVLEGEISFIKKDETTQLFKGDCIIIDPGEIYAWDGSATIQTICTPAWYPQQHKIVLP